MAGKISELAAQTAAALVLTDDIETRDISDTSMAATGTNKRIPWSEILAFLQANGLDTRYVNATGGDSMAGPLTITTTGAIIPLTLTGGSAFSDHALLVTQGMTEFQDGLLVAGEFDATGDVYLGGFLQMGSDVAFPAVANSDLTLGVNGADDNWITATELRLYDSTTANAARGRVYFNNGVLTLGTVLGAGHFDGVKIDTVPLTLAVDPTLPLHAATKQYVDNLIAGLSWKEAVRLATTGNITLSGTVPLDGVVPSNGDRILVKNQTATTENGIYTAAGGAWTRATDANAVGELEGASVFVAEGTVNADTSWVCTTNGPITPGTTATAWAQFASSGGSVAPTRTINTTAPIAGGGTLAADLTLSLNVDGVTNTYLANMAASTIKGNNTGVSADPIDLTIAQVKTMLAIASTDVSGLGSLATKSTIISTDITDGTVANGDLATMAANTIKMNNTAGVASPTDVTIANAQTALAIPALPVTVANGGSGRNTATTAYGLLAAGTTATGIQQTVTPAASGWLKTTSASALPAWTAIANTDVSGLGTLSTKSTIATTDITNDAVDNTKLANMSANSFKGNNTGSVADPIDMTVAQAKTLLAITEADVANLVTDLSNKQPIDPELTAIAGLVSAADQVPYFTGSGTASLMTVTAAARTVLDDTSVANMLATLGGVPTARTISTTAPLTGGGDLSANRTLDISTFTTSVKGAVPPPTTATGKYLKDDGTWAAPSSTPGTGSVIPSMLADADFGDFTVAAGVATIDTNAVTTAKITNNAVTYAKLPIQNALTFLGNPQGVNAIPDMIDATSAKNILNLNNVNNTTDAGKPVSTAQAAADALRVLKAGDTMTGDLRIHSDSGRVLFYLADGTTFVGNYGVNSGALFVNTAVGTSLNLMVNGATRFTVADTQLTAAVPIQLPVGTPGSSLYAAPKSYVDAGDALFTATVKGTVPPPTTATGKFLKDDGTWATAGGTPANGSITPAMLANADFGDFTVASGVGTLDAGVVTLAKMANLAQDQFIGRVTASTGVPETATITAAARTVLDDTTTAAMLTTLGAVPSTRTVFANTPLRINGGASADLSANPTLTINAADTVSFGYVRLATTAEATAQSLSTVAVTPAGLADRQPLDADLTAIAALTATTDNIIQSVGSTWASRTPAQVKTALALDQVTNTSDANKPVSTAQATADGLRVLKAGDTMTGDLTMNANITMLSGVRINAASGGNLQLNAPSGQVVRLMTNAATRLSASDTDVVTTVPLTLPADPTANLHASTKQYVDTRDLVAFTATVNGAVPAPTTATGKFLKDDGTWAAASGGATDVMWVGTSAPSDPTIEVWYDTDETAGVGLDQPTGDARYFPVRQTVVMSAATTYTLALTDENKLLGFSASSAVSVTVPLNSSVAFAQGTRIDLFQFGTGQITIIATGGVTIRATPSLLFRAQGSAATLIKTAGPDTWLLAGDLA